MSTSTGLARCHFIAIGVELVFGSDEEYFAIQDFNRVRNIDLMSPIISGAEGETFNKVMTQWKGAVYPEFKIDEIQKLNKFKEQYEAYKDVKFTIVG